MQVDIVIPCYNQSQWLGECIQSVMEQTHRNWKAIVVDDASTQGDVSQVFNGFNDARLSLIRHAENRGLAAARNSGIRASEGALILPLDADDKLSPRYLEKVVDHFSAHPQCDLVFTDFQTFGATSKVMKFDVCDVPTLFSRQWIPGAGTTQKRSLWERIGGYCEAPELRIGNEDWDFYLAAAEVGFVAGHVPEALYLYRKHSQSMVTRLQQYDYTTRIFMALRHRQSFDSHRTAFAFIADGYKSGIAASFAKSQPIRAFGLILKSAVISPRGLYRRASMLGELTRFYHSLVYRKLYKTWQALKQSASPSARNKPS